MEPIATSVYTRIVKELAVSRGTRWCLKKGSGFEI
jgi:hypothetical protein